MSKRRSKLHVILLVIIAANFSSLLSATPDTVDLALTGTYIPDTLFIGENNHVQICAKNIDPAGYWDYINYKMSVAANGEGENSFSIYERRRNKGNANDSLKMNIDFKINNLYEGEYYLFIQNEWFDANDYIDTILHNNTIVKKITVVQDRNSKPKPIMSFPSDTIYNGQSIHIKDTIIIKHNTPEEISTSVYYRLSGNKEGTDYVNIYSTTVNLAPFVDTIPLDIEVEIPENLPTGITYLSSFESFTNEYKNHKKLYAIREEKDIDLSSIQLIDDTCSINGAIAFTYTINNKWHSFLSPKIINVHLSKDETFNRYEDYIYDYTWVDEAPPLTADTYKASVSFKNVDPGKYYLVFYYRNKDFVDYNHSNDTIIVPVTLIDEPVNLKLASVDIPDTVYAGERITSFFNAKHTTSYVADDPFGCYVYPVNPSDSSRIGDSWGYSSVYNGKEGISFPDTSYRIKVNSNVMSSVTGEVMLLCGIRYWHEKILDDENDNLFYKKIYVKSSKTNIRFESHGAVPDTLNVADDVEVEFNLFNNGDLIAGEFQICTYLSEDSEYSADDNRIDYKYVDSLAPGNSHSGITEIDFPTGTDDGLYYILLKADADNEIIETNEDDNVIAIPVWVKRSEPFNGLSDLVAVPDYREDTVTIYYNEDDIDGYTPLFNINIINTGDVDFSGRLPFIPYLSEDTIATSADVVSYITTYASSLAPADTMPYNFALFGIEELEDLSICYNLYVDIDQNNIIREKDESNNLMGPVIVKFMPGDVAKYDAGLANMVAPDTIQVGKTIEISLDVQNTGNLTIPSIGNTYFTLWKNTAFSDVKMTGNYKYGNTALDSDSIENITQTIETLWDFPTGTYFISTHRRVHSYYPEYNLSNDTIIKKIVLIDTLGISKPNLVAMPFEDTPSVLGFGTNLYKKASVLNASHSEVHSGFIEVYLSGDTIIDCFDKKSYSYGSNIAAGERYEMNYHFNSVHFKNDTCYVILKVDANDKLNESDEKDNVFVHPISMIKVDPPVVHTPEFTLCSPDSINIILGGLQENEKYIWRYGNYYKTLYTTDSITSFAVTGINQKYRVSIDSSGFLSKSVAVQLSAAPGYSPASLITFQELQITPEIPTLQYQWYKDSVLLKDEISSQLLYRKKYGEGHYYLTYRNGCEGEVDLGTIVFPQAPQPVHNSVCNPGNQSFNMSELEPNEAFNFYNTDTVLLFSTTENLIDLEIHEDSTFYYAIDSLNGISELATYKITTHHIPTDTVFIGEDSIFVMNHTPELQYQWMIDGYMVDSLVSNAVPLSIAQLGVISVKISNGICEKVFNIDMVSTGLNNTYYSYSIFPNPADNFLTIKNTTGNVVTKYALTSLDGKPIKSGEFVNQEELINISELNNGMYILILRNNRQIKSFRFIKN